MAENSPKQVSRRDFLKGAAVIGGAVVGGGILIGGTPQVEAQGPTRQVMVPNSKLMLVHVSNRCVGCRRCEVACNLSHDKAVQPSIARVKIQRNRQFGPEGPRLGFSRGQGLFGDFLVIADTCLQCAHPVPCMNACPAAAIEIDPKTNARVINAAKCTGCQTCVKACPWGMISFNAEAKVATKCDLCGGDPQCVKWCPSGAMTVAAWRDKSKDTPVRQVVPAYVSMPVEVSSTCVTCHPTKK